MQSYLFESFHRPGVHKKQSLWVLGILLLHAQNISVKHILQKTKKDVKTSNENIKCRCSFCTACLKLVQFRDQVQSYEWPTACMGVLTAGSAVCQNKQRRRANSDLASFSLFFVSRLPSRKG